MIGANEGMIVAEAAGFGHNKGVSGAEDRQAVLNFADDLRGRNAKMAAGGRGDIAAGENKTATAERTGAGGGSSPEVFGEGVGASRIVRGGGRAQQQEARRNGGGECPYLALCHDAAAPGGDDDGCTGNPRRRGWRRPGARSGTGEGDG